MIQPNYDTWQVECLGYGGLFDHFDHDSEHVIVRYLVRTDLLKSTLSCYAYLDIEARDDQAVVDALGERVLASLIKEHQQIGAIATMKPPVIVFDED